MVERSWTAGTDDPDFWNPKLRGPICLNAAAARSYVPITIKKTEVILARDRRPRWSRSINAAFDKKELPPPEPGAMCYMLSKQGYVSDRGRALASSPDVFRSTNRPCSLGSRPARLTSYSESSPLRTG